MYEKILSNNVEQERIANPSIANQSDGLKLVEPPHLVVVVVGERADSLTYVKKKVQACKKLGIKSTTLRIESSVTQQELIDLINQLNDPNNDIDGVLIQLPLPSHINEKLIICSINPSKDVDGLHPYNIGSLVSVSPQRDQQENHQALNATDFVIGEIKRFVNNYDDSQYFSPCTAEGVLEMLERCNIPIAGSQVTVVGRSLLVGLPVSLLLQKRHATVTMCHSRTRDLGSKCLEADILIVAVGRPHFIKDDWVKPGAVVIDVGINIVDDPESRKGYRLCGDVDFESVRKKCSKITPVPGGVGPMTVAILMRNALKARMRRLAQTLSTQLNGKALINSDQH